MPGRRRREIRSSRSCGTGRFVMRSWLNLSNAQIGCFPVVTRSPVGSVPLSTIQPTPAPKPSTRTNKHPRQNGRSRGRTGSHAGDRHEHRFPHPDAAGDGVMNPMIQLTTAARAHPGDRRVGHERLGDERRGGGDQDPHGYVVAVRRRHRLQLGISMISCAPEDSTGQGKDPSTDSRMDGRDTRPPPPPRRATRACRWSRRSSATTARTRAVMAAAKIAADDRERHARVGNRPLVAFAAGELAATEHGPDGSWNVLPRFPDEEGADDPMGPGHGHPTAMIAAPQRHARMNMPAEAHRSPPARATTARHAAARSPSAGQSLTSRSTAKAINSATKASVARRAASLRFPPRGASSASFSTFQSYTAPVHRRKCCLPAIGTRAGNETVGRSLVKKRGLPATPIRARSVKMSSSRSPRDIRGDEERRGAVLRPMDCGHQFESAKASSDLIRPDCRADAPPTTVSLS